MIWSLFDMGIMEHCAPNRSGKSFLHALGAWWAFNAGKTVYANCPMNPGTGEVDHILNFPHVDYDPYQLRFSNLFDVYVLTDQAEQVMDARVCAKKDVRQMGYFLYQAKKRGLSYHYDTVRHKNIDPRLRLIPDQILYPHRIPENWREPLRAIRLTISHAHGETNTIIRNPSVYFGDPAKGIMPIYNDKVMLRPPA